MEQLDVHSHAFGTLALLSAVPHAVYLGDLGPFILANSSFNLGLPANLSNIEVDWVGSPTMGNQYSANLFTSEIELIGGIRRQLDCLSAYLDGAAYYEPTTFPNSPEKTDQPTSLIDTTVDWFCTAHGTTDAVVPEPWATSDPLPAGMVESQSSLSSLNARLDIATLGLAGSCSSFNMAMRAQFDFVLDHLEGYKVTFREMYVAMASPSQDKSLVVGLEGERLNCMRVGGQLGLEEMWLGRDECLRSATGDDDGVADNLVPGSQRQPAHCASDFFNPIAFSESQLGNVTAQVLMNSLISDLEFWLEPLRSTLQAVKRRKSNLDDLIDAVQELSNRADLVIRNIKHYEVRDIDQDQVCFDDSRLKNAVDSLRQDALPRLRIMARRCLNGIEMMHLAQKRVGIVSEMLIPLWKGEWHNSSGRHMSFKVFPHLKDLFLLACRTEHWIRDLQSQVDLTIIVEGH
jgi:hypothetical protein